MSDSVSVLVTGSAGRLGSAACTELLAHGHQVRGFDVRESPGLADAVVGDLANPEDVSKAMADIEVVIHLAATPDEDDFMSKLLPNNIIGLYNVLESARQTDVRRVMLASSGQVVRGHTGPWPITSDLPVSPRNWYASAKLLAESAGQVYAHDHGLSVIVVRLGWCPRDQLHAEELAATKFGEDVYLSPGDAGQFFRCAVEAPTHITYCVVFATSKHVNRARFDISSAKELLGFEPRDTWPEGIEFDIRES